MIEIKASKGLGDALYLRAIALHLLERGEAVTIFTLWPEAFHGVAATVKGLDQLTGAEDLELAAYCVFCRNPALERQDQFTRACLQVGIREPVALRLDWKVRNPALVERIKAQAGGRPILVYQPNKKANNPEQALLRPRSEAFNAHLAAQRECFRVKVGTHHALDRDEGAPCDLDLFDRTSVSDVIDIATAADRFFGETCWLLVAAEALDKPFTCMFSRRGLASPRRRVCNVTPALVFHKPHLTTAVFDE